MHKTMGDGIVMEQTPREPAIHDWPTENVVLFSAPEKPYGFLSNRAPGFPLAVNGIVYLSAEALFQVCHFPDHPDLQRKIIADQNGKRVSWYARLHFDKVRPDWPHLRIDVMRWVLRRKFSQYEHLADQLLATEFRPIIFQSFDDTYWGASYARRGNGTYGDEPVFQGRNILGRLLMDLRQERKEQGAAFIAKASAEPPASISLPHSSES